MHNELHEQQRNHFRSRCRASANSSLFQKGGARCPQGCPHPGEATHSRVALATCSKLFRQTMGVDHWPAIFSPLQHLAHLILPVAQQASALIAELCYACRSATCARDVRSPSHGIQNHTSICGTRSPRPNS
eukprot:9719047-Karenia_brevis.AAC.1